MSPDIVYWSSAYAMAALTIIAAPLWVYSIRRLHKATARVQAVADERAELQERADWTILSITGRDGQIWSSTIGDLLQEKPEKVWTDPIAIAIWDTRPIEEKPGV